MLREIESAVVIAAKAGAEFAVRRDAERALNEWSDYAATLQEQLARARRGFEEKNLEVLKRDKLIQEQMVQLEQQRQTILEKDTLLAINRDFMFKKADESAEYKSFLTKKVVSIERQCQATSAKLVAYEEIYKLLVQEIKAIDNPERFKNLDPKVRLDAMNKVWNGFLKTGQVAYSPDLQFTEITDTKKIAP